MNGDMLILFGVLFTILFRILFLDAIKNRALKYITQRKDRIEIWSDGRLDKYISTQGGSDDC